MGFGSGGKANGLYQSSSDAMAAAKKPNMQLIQADHELFLQAFESELLLPASCLFKYIIKVTGKLYSGHVNGEMSGCIAGGIHNFTAVELTYCILSSS